MTAGRRYLLGLAFTAGLGGIMMALAPAPTRTQVGWGAAVGLVLQAPLGWWAIQSIGTERFLLVWGLGMLVRLLVLALAGLAVVPLLGWEPGPALGALAVVLVTLLFVEGITAWREYSEEGGKR